jgi:hypothetical protein
MNERRRLRKMRPKDLRRTGQGAERTSRRVEVPDRRSEASSQREGAVERKGLRDDVDARPRERVHEPSRQHARGRATGDERDRRRRGGIPWWVWLLGLLALGLIAFMIFAGGTDEPSEGTGATGTEETSTGADAGALTAGSTNLLSLAASGDDLSQYEGESVTDEGVVVESVVGDEAIWVGNSPTERLFVFLDLQDESGPDINAGDRVDLSGTLEGVPSGFADELGVTADEGADQLEEQGSYIKVRQVQAS